MKSEQIKELLRELLKEELKVEIRNSTTYGCGDKTYFRIDLKLADEVISTTDFGIREGERKQGRY